MNFAYSYKIMVNYFGAGIAQTFKEYYSRTLATAVT
jgi:hypothetical protein